jgi:hypothetical protein
LRAGNSDKELNLSRISAFYRPWAGNRQAEEVLLEIQCGIAGETVRIRTQRSKEHSDFALHLALVA